MNVFLRFLFIFCVILTIYLQEGEPLNNSSKGPGISLCVHKHGGINCTFNDIPVDTLPQSCSAFVYEYLSADLNFDVHHTYSDDELDQLDKLCKIGKNVYVSYGYAAGEWQIALACMTCDPTNALDESKSINAFLKKHPNCVTGLILRNLEFWFRTRESIGYTENLVKYIEIIKQETGLEIALGFVGDVFQYYYENSNIPWLDFSVLDKYVDFYSIRLFSYFNECTYRLRKGVLPITGNQDNTFTKLGSIIQKAGIPKEKMYYNFLLIPRANDNTDACEKNYQWMCKSPKTTKHWCADTQETYFQKGQWIKQNGAGFIGAYLNYDDPLGCCNCGPYPSFNAILAGLNGTASIPPCPLYDRS